MSRHVACGLLLLAGCQWGGIAAYQSSTNSDPPDTYVAVGPTLIAEVVNATFAVYGKNGMRLYYGAWPVACGSFDPRIEYDPMSQRFFFVAVNTISSVCVGLTLGNDPRGLWATFVIPTNFFPDQPKIQITDDALIIGGNDIGPGTTRFLVLDKAALLAGAVVQVAYDGTAGWQCVPARPSDSTRHVAYYADIAPQGIWVCFNRNEDPTTRVRLRFFAGTGASMQTRALEHILFANHGYPQNPQHAGSASTLDLTDNRPLDAIYRGGHLWAVTQSACKPTGDTVDRTCPRYLHFLIYGSPWVPSSFADSGLLEDFKVKFGKGVYGFFPAIQMDTFGNMVSVYNRSSASEFISIEVMGEPNGLVNTVTTPCRLMTSPGPWQPTAVGDVRWGDYNAAALAPDGFTFVVAAEYARQPTLWGTMVTRFTAFDGCTTAGLAFAPSAGLEIDPGDTRLAGLPGVEVP